MRWSFRGPVIGVEVCHFCPVACNEVCCVRVRQEPPNLNRHVGIDGEEGQQKSFEVIPQCRIGLVVFVHRRSQNFVIGLAVLKELEKTDCVTIDDRSTAKVCLGN